jgi:hypothetical protein
MTGLGYTIGAGSPRVRRGSSYHLVHDDMPSNPAWLVQFSKMSKGLPELKYPQSIEKCSNCLISKKRRAARGHNPGFVATVFS